MMAQTPDYLLTLYTIKMEIINYIMDYFYYHKDWYLGILTMNMRPLSICNIYLHPQYTVNSNWHMIVFCNNRRNSCPFKLLLRIKHPLIVLTMTTDPIQDLYFTPLHNNPPCDLLTHVRKWWLSCCLVLLYLFFLQV